MKTKLIGTDSELYKKRMVRELNSLGLLDGFYFSHFGENLRGGRARLVGVAIQCRHNGAWLIADGEQFLDVYGRAVCVRRIA